MNAPVAFYLRNHSASELLSAPLASLPTLSVRPSFPTKDAYAAWCHAGTTSHVFYTLAEPENKQARSSGTNPVKFLQGVVADYDGSPEAIAASLPSLKFAPGKAPTWVTTTYSKKARLVWAFERPVPVFTGEVFARFMAILAKDLDLKKLLPGLDEGALVNPHTPYELGTDWREPYGDNYLPSHVVLAALHDSSDKAKWKTTGPDIPLDAIAAEVEKRWPGRWKGPMEAGMKGIRFWDTRADNQTGCTIRREGVQAWTGEGKFIPWHELLGDEFVRRWRTSRIGGAIDGFYFDGRDYWNRDEAGHWRDLNSDAVKRHMAVLHGLSTESKKGQPSEVAQALTTIDRMRRVDGAFPCLYAKDEVVRDSTSTFLNISRVKPVRHDKDSREWADGFPWLANYLETIFDEKQLQVFLSWLHRFYKNAVLGKPKKGHALFVAGPVSAGKTFLAQRIVGGLMGGFQEATRYVLGETSFNESLFHAPVWAVDDAVATAEVRQHSMYSQIVKKIVANPYQEYHAKFKRAVTFRWEGRLVVTMNDDPESITMLPQADGSILDKYDALKARTGSVNFRDADDKAAAELPYFADFIFGYMTPEWLLTKPDEVSRYGHDAWQHPELLQTAKDSSSSAGLFELLVLWREYHFRASDKPVWEGSGSALYADMNQMDGVRGVLPRAAPTHHAFTRGLQKIIRQGEPWIAYRPTTTGRVYQIKRPEKSP